MNIIHWILLIFFSVFLLSNEGNHQVAVPFAYLFLGIILFFITPHVIFNVVKNDELAALVALLGANAFGVLFASYTLYNRYEDIYLQPVVPALWWTLLYIMTVAVICSLTRKKK